MPPQLCARSSLVRGDPEFAKFDTLTPEQHGLHLGHVHLGFGWQVRCDLVEGGGFIFLEQALHGAFASVVGSEGKSPILELLVEKLEVAGGSFGAGFRSVALINGE